MSARRYLVRAIFDTLQGEGLRAGCRSVFIRFAGCNQWNGIAEGRTTGSGACAKWCDTDFRGDRSKWMTAEEIVEAACALWPEKPGVEKRHWDRHRYVVFTGGEPLLQLDTELLDAIHDAGFRVAVETNGTVRPKPGVAPRMDHVCVSPKLERVEGVLEIPELEVLVASELKVVLPGAVEGDGWTEEMLDAMGEMGEWGVKFVQPMDPRAAHADSPQGLSLPLVAGDAAREARIACVQFVLRRPSWRLGVQMHKLFNLE